MPSITRHLSIVMTCVPFCACVPNPNATLLFAQSQTLGVSINASTTQQSAELTLGYRDLDIAIVPVVAHQGSGEATQLKADALGPDKA